MPIRTRKSDSRLTRQALATLPLAHRSVAIGVAFATWVVLSIAASPAVAQDKTPITEEQRKLHLDSFDFVWETVRDRYWDKTLGGLDWDGVRAELRPRVESASEHQEVRNVLDEMLSRLGVSHFGIIPSEAYEAIETENRRAGTSGIEARVVAGDALVVRVEAGSTASELGIQPGWQIRRIGDWVVTDSLALLNRRLAEHPHLRTILSSSVEGRLSGTPDEVIEVEFVGGEGEPVTHAIKLGPSKGRPVKFGHIPEFHVWLEARRLESNVGYIRFNAFMAPTIVMIEFNKAMLEFMDCDALIIDIRGNGGGMAEMGMGMIGWLVKEESTPVGKVVLREQELNLVVRGRPTTFDRPVVVLIDEMSVSAAEFFACAVRDIQRAHLIGTRTAGAVLGSQFVRLPNGDGFQFAAANFTSVTTGEAIEGIGVEPHESVAPSRPELLAGKDPALEAAFRWIAKQDGGR